jgi:hypothetical protein
MASHRTLVFTRLLREINLLRRKRPEFLSITHNFGLTLGG